MSDAATYEDILYEERDGAAWITINRPKVYNAFRAQTCEELSHALRRAGWNRDIGVIVLGAAIQTLAVLGSALFKGLPQEQSGKIILLVAKQALPVWVGCIVMASIAAIVTSTATSFLLVPATNIMRDIYQRFINPELSDKKVVLYSRIAVIFLGGAAYALIQFFPRILDRLIPVLHKIIGKLVKAIE